MARDYSVDIIERLKDQFAALRLHRPLRIARYDTGTTLDYAITPVEPGPMARVKLQIERFVGGGFAGQVYRVRVLEILEDGRAKDAAAGLRKDGLYALKILIPPSEFSRLFRNLLYYIGFQGPFQLQVNPAAARAGALWQKFIRKAAGVRFGDEQSVNDIHATFMDRRLGSCGEISDWVEGRTWRLEVDDRLDLLKRWRKGKPLETDLLGSPEYRSKFVFMHEFVDLLHEMGAHEFARQYEWTTCKSQPNCLKRLDTNAEPEKGLIAVDFRAGLTLLPFLPMSPGDFKLIGQGLKRGSLVQFDRGDLDRLRRFIDANPAIFADIPHREQMFRELEECEDLYRNSVPDITHNHIRLFYDKRLWATMFASAVSGWKVCNLIDEPTERTLRNSPFKTFLFFLLGLIPLLGRVLRKCWGRPDWRAHYRSICSDAGYFLRAIRGRIFEKLMDWHRTGRLREEQILSMADHPWKYFLHRPLSILPIGLHRFIVDSQSRKEALYVMFVRPFKLFFNQRLRVEWMREMIVEGRNSHMLTKEDAAAIESRLDEPYIQKYLVSLVVHLMTIFVSETVYVAVGIWYWTRHPELPDTQRAAMTAAVMALINLSPISPGSLCRGLYVLWLMIRERDYRNYSIALYLSVVRIVGYLAFPIQMTYRYPVLARFMAAHWATNAVHKVPVFGEQGALLERSIFDLFYNWPLTIRRRMARVSEFRRSLPVRRWHIPPATLAAGAAMALVHGLYLSRNFEMPARENFWLLKPLLIPVMLVPFISGWIVTRFAGGMSRGKRLLWAALSGVPAAAVYTIGAVVIETQIAIPDPAWVFPLIWRAFIFTIFAFLGAFVAEVKTQDPELKAEKRPQGNSVLETSPY